MTHTSAPNPIPKPLLPGDRIGIAAPSSAFGSTPFSDGLEVLKSLGFELFLPRGLHETDGYLAGSDRHRAEILHQLFREEAVDGIFCARGGFGALRILELLDADTIRDHPKTVVGYSDITALLATLYGISGLVVFHGPVVSDLRNATRATLDALLKAIAFQPVPWICINGEITVGPGSATGPLIGGNLTTLCSMIGTPFQPDFSGHLLFFEDRGEACYRIDRMLSQMKLAGCFEGIAGVLLGSFEGCGDLSEIIRVAEKVFSHLSIPIAAGFRFGHGEDNLTIPIGLPAVLDADSQSVVFTNPYEMQQKADGS